MSSLKDGVELIGGVVGVLASLFGGWTWLSKRRKKAERVRTLQSVGDRFAGTADMEGEGYEKAIEEYEKALALDDANPEVHRSLIAALRHRLELQPPVRWRSVEGQAEVNAVLTALYEHQASRPVLKNDKALMLEEARILRIGGRLAAAAEVLERARALYPGHADVLADLGFVRAMVCPENRADGVELIRRALAIRPDEPAHHYALAQALDKAGDDAAAIRAYRRAAELSSSGRDIWTRRVHNGALSDLLQLFRKISDQPGGVASAELPMPVPERIETLQYALANFATTDRRPHYFLACLYRALGDYERGQAEIRQALGDDRSSWKYYLPMLEVYAAILEQRGSDPATLSEVRAILQSR